MTNPLLLLTEANVVAILGSLIAAATTVIVAALGRQQRRSHKTIEEISESVNHRHAKSKGVGLLDLTVQMSEKLGRTQEHVERVDVKIDKLDGQVAHLRANQQKLLTDPPCRIHQFSNEDIERILTDGEG